MSSQDSSCKIFISYAPSDADAARGISEILRREYPSLFTPDWVEPAPYYNDVIDRKIEESDICIPIISRNALESAFVRNEWSKIQEKSWRDKNFRIAPIFIDASAPPAFLQKWQGFRYAPRDPNTIKHEILKVVQNACQGATPPEYSPNPIEQISGRAERFKDILDALADEKAAEASAQGFSNAAQIGGDARTLSASLPNDPLGTIKKSDLEEFQKLRQYLGQYNVDATMEIFGEWNKGWQVIAAEMTDYTKRSFEEGTTTFEKLLSAKSVEQAVEIQTGFAKRAYDGYMHQLSKIGGLYEELAKQRLPQLTKALTGIPHKKV